MSPAIETLENRVLLSVTPAQLQADAQALVTNFRQAANVNAAFEKVLDHWDDLLGTVEVRGRRELLKGGVAFDDRDLQASGSENGRFVRRNTVRPQAVRLLQRVEAEGLRRLDSDQPAAIDRFFEASVRAGEGVADWKDRRGAVEELELGDEPVNDRRRAEGAGGIMDQHGVSADCRQA